MKLLSAAACLAALILAAAAPAQAADAPRIQRMPVVGGAQAEPGRYPKEMVVPGQSGFDGGFLATTVYRTPAGSPLVIVWESGPGVLRTDGYPYDEYCLVLEGELEIENADGGRERFGAGDAFVIPKGWRGVWNMKTRFRKQYIALTPPDAAPSN